MTENNDVLWDIVQLNDFLSFECCVARVKISRFIFPSTSAETVFSGFSEFGLEQIQKYLHIGVVCSETARQPLKKNEIILLNMPKGLSQSAYKERVLFQDCKKVRTIIFSVPTDVYEECLHGTAPMDQILVATSILTKLENWRFIEYEIFSAYCKSFEIEAIQLHLDDYKIDSQQSDLEWQIFLLMCGSHNIRKSFRKLLKTRWSKRNRMMLAGSEYFEEYSVPFVEGLSQLAILYKSMLTHDITFRPDESLTNNGRQKHVEEHDRKETKIAKSHSKPRINKKSDAESYMDAAENGEMIQHCGDLSQLLSYLRDRRQTKLKDQVPDVSEENSNLISRVQPDANFSMDVDDDSDLVQDCEEQPDAHYSMDADDEVATTRSDSDDDDVEFKCLDCGDQFENSVSFYLHTKTHKNYRKYVCKLCGVRFLKSSGLQRHVDAIHTGKKPYKCEICERKFSLKHLLERHTKSHSASRDFPCLICHKDYSTKRNLEVHMRVHTGEKPFECDMCDKKFTSSQNMKLHQKLHYDLRLFVCKYCGRSFGRNGTCKYHMEIQHERKKNVAFQCYSCKEQFTCTEKLLSHASTHSKKRTIECKKCFKKFDVESELREHQENVHSTHKPFECQDCGAQFSRGIDRDRHHIRKHKGEATVMCSYCGKGFYMTYDCRRHELLVHQKPVPKIIKV